MGAGLGTPLPHGGNLANICPYAVAPQVARGTAVPAVVAPASTVAVARPGTTFVRPANNTILATPSNFVPSVAPAASSATGTTIFTPAQAGNWLTAPSITEAVPAGPNLLGALNGVAAPVQGFAQADPALVQEYNDWRNNAKFDDYLSVRKYYTWKKYCNGDVDNWTQYGKWKNIWSQEDSKQFKPEYKVWKNLTNTNFLASDFQLWKEWSGWKAVKCELQKRWEQKKDRKVGRNYRKYKRWAKKVLKDLDAFAKYYKYVQWRQHADSNKCDWKDWKGYNAWVDKHWDSCKGGLKDYYQNWSSRWNSRDFARDFDHWSDWNSWRNSRDYADDDYASHGDGRSYASYGHGYWH